MKLEQKAIAIIFKHTDGWTISDVVFSKQSAEFSLKKHKEILPEFKYRIVPVKILFNVLK